MPHSIFVLGDSNTVERNDAKKNDGDGIVVAGDDNAVTKNKAEKNEGFGYTDSSTATPNTYTDNTCKQNGLGGSDPTGLCTPQP